MPAYVIEFQSGQVPHRRRFTLDDHRPLRDQLEHVLAELEREGILLRGGPMDELVARWEGRELDGDRSPAELRLTPERPLELRMQRRRTAVHVPPTPDRPPERFTPRGVYAAAAWGLLGGALAWGLDALVADRGGPLTSDAALDVLAAALWGAGVAGCVVWGASRRIDRAAAGPATLATLAGGVIGGLWAAAATMFVAPTAAGRVVVWAGLAALVAAALLLFTRHARRVAWTLPAAGGVGLLVGALAALPWAGVLWQALAFGLAGAGVGATLAAAAARGAPAVLQLEALAERGVGVTSLREWELRDGAVAWVRDLAPGAEPGAVQVMYAGGRCQVQSAGASGVGRELRHGDRLTVGRSRYRFRRRVVA